MWGCSSVEVKELRHRGRLWRLADFVGGTGGSTKPSTDECCRKKPHISNISTDQQHPHFLTENLIYIYIWTPILKYNLFGFLALCNSKRTLPTATMQQSTAVEICVFAKAEIFAVQTQMNPLT